MSNLPSLLQTCGLIAPGDHVVCAVSGGVDSMVLLWSLLQQARQLGITLEACHFDHRLRGEESRQDQRFVQDFCQSHGIRCITGGADVGAFAGENHMSIEQAARTLRYRFFDSIACDKLALAHHANDNAETILLNLLRGTGLRGLCGIPPVRGRYIRPLLTVSRQDILAFAQANQIPYREDSTNVQRDALRNRIRLDWIPLLLQENPGWIQTASAMSLRLRKEEEVLRRQARLLLDGARIDGGFSVQVLCAYPDGLRERVLRLILDEQGLARPTHRHVALLEGLIHAEIPSATVSLPGGVTACRRYDALLFSGEKPDPWAPVLLNPNGTTLIPPLKLAITCSPAQKQINTPSVFTVVPRGQIIARPRRTGDRLQTAVGSRSVKKLMIDRKIPRALRELLPVIEDEGGLLAVSRIGADHSRIGAHGAITIKMNTF